MSSISTPSSSIICFNELKLFASDQLEISFQMTNSQELKHKASTSIITRPPFAVSTSLKAASKVSVTALKKVAETPLKESLSTASQ